MTKTGAIKLARSRVAIVPYGDGYCLQTTWQSHIMDYWRAKECAREAKLREALRALEIEEPDGTAAELCFNHEGTWTKLLDIALEEARKSA